MIAKTSGVMLVMTTLDQTSNLVPHASNASAACTGHFADCAARLTRCAAQISKSIDALDAVSSTGIQDAKPALWLPNETAWQI